MKIDLKLINKDLLKLIKIISQQADEDKVSVYLVGGIVRDILLKKPNLDLDIVIEADSLRFASILSKKLKTKMVFYPQFKTATVLCDKVRVDIARARKEYYPSKGALPVVENGVLVEDLFRRDFTINAMAISLNRNNFGELIDPFLGWQDLQKGLIRILHDKSFEDDPTRILRAIRFEQRLSFKIEDKTFELLKEGLVKGYDAFVKPPRYFAEFKKFFKEKSFEKTLVRFQDLHGFNFLFNDFRYDGKAIAAVRQFIRINPSLIEEEDKLFIYFLAIIEHLASQSQQEIAQKFHFKKEEKKAILDGLLIEKYRKVLLKPRLKRSDVYLLLRYFSLERLVVWVALEKNFKVNKYFKNYLLKDRDVALVINGSDLKSLGVLQGQHLGEILSKLLCFKIDGKIKTKKDELRLAKTLIRKY